MSINRYRKRDTSEVNRKSELGLDRVDNYSSSEITETVIQGVRDYMYTPASYQLKSQQGAYGILKFFKSGHTMFTATLYKQGTVYNPALGYDEVTYIPVDTLSGSVIYTKPSLVSGKVAECPVYFDILGDTENSPYFMKANLVITSVLEERQGSSADIVTYIGVDFKDIDPTLENVTRIGINLHDYTLESVDYHANILPGTSTIINVPWEFPVVDWTGTKKCKVAVPIYDMISEDYVVTREGVDVPSAGKDVATINGIPFCGAYQVTVDGQDARHIVVPAKHAGPGVDLAGKHNWDCLSSWPVNSYSVSGDASGNQVYKTNRSLSTSAIDGLCHLASFSTGADGMEGFMESLGYFEGDTKNEALTDSSVVTVGALAKFWDHIQQYVTEYVKTETTPKIIGTECVFTLDKGSTSFSSPGTTSIVITPRSKVIHKLDNGTTTDTGTYTEMLKFSFAHPELIQVKVGGQVLEDTSKHPGYYKTSLLDGNTNIEISIIDPLTSPDILSSPITFTTFIQYRRDQETILSLTKTATFNLSFKNNNNITTGLLVAPDSKTMVGVIDNASSGAPYYERGSKVTYRWTYNDCIQRSGNFIVYLNQVSRVNDTFVKNKTTNLNLNGTGSLQKDTNPTSNASDENIWKLSDTVSSGSTRNYSITDSTGTVIQITIEVEGKPTGITLDKTEHSFNSDPTVLYVKVSSHYEVARIDNTTTWAKVEKYSADTYAITAPRWTVANDFRAGTITFVNRAGKSATLKVTQLGSADYLYAIPVAIGTRVTPGNSIDYLCETSNSEVFSFNVYSNVGFDVYVGSTLQGSYTSTNGSASRIDITIPANRGGSAVVTKVSVKNVNKFGENSIEFNLVKMGTYDEMVVLEPTDKSFRTDIDPVRAEKVFMVACQNPNNLKLTFGDGALLMRANIYHKTSRYAMVHVSPKSIQPLGNDTEAELKLGYGGTTKSIRFKFLKNNFDKYFNISSTILTFTKSDVSSRSLTLTGWSIGGSDSLTLKPIGNAANVVNISKSIVGENSYLYAKWYITIPAGHAPQKGLPWTLQVMNGTSVKYVHIYETSDVELASTPDKVQLTAFGHYSTLDGCSFTPILYERRKLTVKIGHTANPASTDPVVLSHIVIKHDLTDLTKVSGSSNWNINKVSGTMEYVTIDNGGVINPEVTGATFSFSGKTCAFSSNIDLEGIYDGNPGYSTVIGSEVIATEGKNIDLMTLPNGTCTLGPLEIPALPKSYKSLGKGPEFIVSPPDWNIESSIRGSEFLDGYLTLPKVLNKELSGRFSIDSKNVGGVTMTGNETLIVNFVRSEKIETTIVNEGATSTILDLQKPDDGYYFKFSPGSGLQKKANTDGSIGYYSPYYPIPMVINNENFVYSSFGASGISFSVASDWLEPMGCLQSSWNSSGTSSNTFCNIWGSSTLLAYNLDSSEVLNKSNPYWSTANSGNLFVKLCNTGIYNYTYQITRANDRVATLNVGIAAIAKTISTSTAYVVYVPYVTISSVSGGKSETTNYLIIKDTDFGVGQKDIVLNQVNAPAFGYQVTEGRTLPVGGNYQIRTTFKSSQNSSNFSSYQFTNPIAIPGTSAKVSQNFDFSITPEDYSKIINHHMTSKYGMSVSKDTWTMSAANDPFLAEKGRQMYYYVPQTGWLRDLKINIHR